MDYFRLLTLRHVDYDDDEEERMMMMMMIIIIIIIKTNSVALSPQANYTD
jgi:hypothetical protein